MKYKIHNASILFCFFKALPECVERFTFILKHPISGETAIEELKEEGVLSENCELRQVKYLNNNVEQDHRFIKQLVKPGLGFGSFNTAKRTLKGYEMMNMIRKGQVEGIKKGDVKSQVEFIENLFRIAA